MQFATQSATIEILASRQRIKKTGKPKLEQCILFKLFKWFSAGPMIIEKPKRFGRDIGVIQSMQFF